MAFVKAVRASKIILFDAQDVSQAAQHPGETDPTLGRTVALMGKGPDAIARWVGDATNASLALYLPDAALDEHITAKSLFDCVVRTSIDDLTAKDKQRRAKAQNILRLALTWLLGQRNLSPTDALQSVRKVKKVRKAKKRKSRETAASLDRDAVLLLGRAKLNQLLDLSLIAALFESAIVQETKERQKALSSLIGLKEQIASLELELQTTIENLETANEEIARLSDELEAAQRGLSDEKELRVLERTKQAGRFRRFMAERLSQSLSDACDALDFEPPHVDAARQRIEMAIAAINEEIDKSNE